jgi:hypothetical protein
MVEPFSGHLVAWRRRRPGRRRGPAVGASERGGAIGAQSPVPWPCIGEATTCHCRRVNLAGLLSAIRAARMSPPKRDGACDTLPLAVLRGGPHGSRGRETLA